MQVIFMPTEFNSNLIIDTKTLGQVRQSIRKIRERERERERQTDRQTDRQRQRERERQTDRQTERERERERDYPIHTDAPGTLVYSLDRRPSLCDSNDS